MLRIRAQNLRNILDKTIRQFYEGRIRISPNCRHLSPARRMTRKTALWSVEVQRLGEVGYNGRLVIVITSIGQAKVRIVAIFKA